jgi:ligand-binding sensor domain-containing protein/AraC-like DNA-binding protein
LALVKHIYRIFLLLVLVSAQVSAQSYDFRHYQVEQGLSYNSVFGILQDSKGFMWFATKDGLNRFDGYTFKIFRNDHSDTTSIGSNLTLCLYEDSKQTLWIGTSKGMYKYNDTLENFSVVPGTLNKYIVDIKSDKDSKMFLLFDGRIHTYNKLAKRLSLLSKKQDFSASSMLFTGEGTLWVSASDGYLKRYHVQDDTFETFNVFEHSTSVSAHWIDRIYLTKNNSILIGTSHQGVKLFDMKTLTYKDILTYNTDQTPIFAKNFIHYEGDTYWIATESGIFIYNLKTGAYTRLKKDHDNPYALSDNAIYTFAKDREGGVWAGTYFGGVNYYPKPFTAFEKHFSGSSVFPMSGNAIREIDTDKYGNLWVATEDAGLNKISPSGKVQLFKPGGGLSSIAHTNIHGILAVDDELWIGTYEQGLDVLDIPTGKVIRHYNKGNGLNDIKSNFVETIYKTNSGMLLLGTSYGLVSYNRAENNFKPLEGFPQEHHYMCIIEDESGTIWAGTIGNGLFYYNPRTGRRGEYQAGDTKSISDNFINSLFIDRNHRLWVTTENGLNCFDAKRKVFLHYGKREGFPSNVFYRIEQDMKGTLWLSTAKGLVSFNPNMIGMSIKMYTKETGLLSDQFNYNSSYIDKSGKLYFGSVNGMVAFNPLTFSVNGLAPSIYITGFQVFNNELIIGAGVLKKSITFTEQVELEIDQSTFSIDFAALTYTDFGTYEYKLEGIDKSYTRLSKNRRVFYTKLSPGTYTFSVRGSNSSGVWSKEFRKLVIIIHPPFYKTYWAYTFYLLVATAIIWCIIFYLRKRQLEKEQRKSELLANQKERELYQAKADSFNHLITMAQSKPDQALLNQVNEFIIANLSDTSMDVDQLAENLNMSRATFYRKVKAISDLSPNELINITRLKKAAELLLNTDLKIQQVANQTGFSAQAQFSRSFTKQFGMSPTEYVQNRQRKSAN